MIITTVTIQVNKPCVQTEPRHPVAQVHTFGDVHLPPFSHVSEHIADK